jgi:hypothetical protein
MKEKLSYTRGAIATGFLTADSPGQLDATQYLLLLFEGKYKQAQSPVTGLLQRGKLAPAVYEHISEATRYGVRLLWRTDKFTVAREPYCTAAAQSQMSTYYAGHSIPDINMISAHSENNRIKPESSKGNTFEFTY